MAELPGVGEDKVKMEVDSRYLDDKKRHLRKETLLRRELSVSGNKHPAESKLRNGVLKIKLIKTKPSREKDTSRTS